jgi:hypothetical protein
VKTRATQLMIVSVYGVDDALVVVRLNAGFVLEGNTSG